MRYIHLVLFASILLSSCGTSQKEESYKINGKAQNIANGSVFRLAIINPKGRQVLKDSAVVKDEKFTLKGSIEEPSVHFLSLDGSAGNTIFMLENNNINIDFNKENPMESVITGSVSNAGYKAFINGMTQFKDESVSIMAEFKALGTRPEKLKRDSIAKALKNLRERQNEYPLIFTKENNNSYFSLNLMELESSRPGFNVVEYQKAFENFTPKLKESKKGLIVKQKLDSLLLEYNKVAKLEIGNLAPNFEAPTPNGNIISLNKIKGKVTIIDFWAAWCGPCRRENPNVVKIYNKYHAEGLEIIGVSLDGASRQKDPKKAWLDAIEKDNLTWHQVSNLNYFNDPVAKLYNINSIPATYILNAKGEIVAKNLRGSALENKVKALLFK